MDDMKVSVGSNAVGGKDLKTTRRALRRSLRSGSGKSLGPIETLKMKMLGARDGSSGIPRKMPERGWTSSLIERELASFEAFCSQVYGKLELQMNPMYIQLGALAEIIAQKESRLHDLRSQLEQRQADLNGLIVERKRGEDRLSEGQVAARRAREFEHSLAPLKAEISAIQQELNDVFDQFWEMRSCILEANSIAAQVCRRVLHRKDMRITVYWNAALKRHPATDEMPVIPPLPVEMKAESKYIDDHKHILAQAEKLFTRHQRADGDKEAA